MMVAFLSQWGHAAAAAMFAALALWFLPRVRHGQVARSMVSACGLTAIWALLTAANGPETMSAMVAEVVRNLGWLALMYAFWRRDTVSAEMRTVVALYGALLLVGFLQIAATLAGPAAGPATGAAASNLATYSGFVLGMLFSVGGLVLVHNLYTAGTSDTRMALRLPLTAIAVIWVYDLNLYTVSYLSGVWSSELIGLRGIAVAMVAPLVALSANVTSGLRVHLSRTATFQTLSLGAIGAYLGIMIVVNTLIGAIMGDLARPLQVAFVFGSSVIALVLLPSPRFRAWFKIKVAKHLFQHRYDYRSEWLRFSETLGKPEEGEGRALEARAVQALADITESPSGCLLVTDGAGGMEVRARWNWPGLDAPIQGATIRTIEFFERTGRIVELDAVRLMNDQMDEEGAAIPEWLIGELSAWVVVPLLHYGRLNGLVVLGRPAMARTLDWEDFDLLKVVGRQVATYLAEANGQHALATAQRFDEFNRRFAFIMHDVKNLVSQLTLVARNAEKHAGNPDFQADMIATLKSSVARMNDLLARLSQHNKAQAEPPRAIALTPLVARVAAAKRLQMPVVTSGDVDLYLIADPVRLEQALSHLVQNAIDASPPAEPVTINMRTVENNVLVEVIDRGCGMTPQFVHNELFKPFASTKAGGFGVGAFEARSLITAMGGRIEVHSREGEGTTFRIFLPIARDSINLTIDTEARAA